jgi:hypothetical protein
MVFKQWILRHFVICPVYLTSYRQCYVEIYADNNYLFSSGETEKKALENCIKETKIAMKWFLNSEFCVNQKKTEVSVFYQNDSRACKAVFGSEKVNVLKNMKILGLIFDSKLNWYHQTVTAIEKANKAK